MTQMAQAISKAMETAGRKPKPMTERVWNHIKDNPRIGLKALEGVFGPTVAQTIHALHLRKMVTRITEPRRMPAGSVRNIYLYSVAMREYELLPLPSKNAAAVASAPRPGLGFPGRPAPQALTPSFAPPSAPAPKPKELASDRLDEYIDGLPVGEARLLFIKLKAIFG